MRRSGLGVVNKSLTALSGNNFFSSYFAPLLCPVSFTFAQIVDGGSPGISFKYVRRMRRLLSSENLISPVFIFSCTVSHDQRHPFGGCEIMPPSGAVTLYCKVGRQPGFCMLLPSNHGPFGSLSGFLKCFLLSGSSIRLGRHRSAFEYTSVILWS